ncbi:MAG: hypothetical protein SNI45_04730 [Rikenellaceae bacterium]
MKINIKYIAAAALSLMLALPLTVSAQEEKSTFSLPKAGDFSFGIDAAPVINFLGNTLNGTISQELDDIGGTPTDTEANTSLISPDISIMGRYMLSRNTALRMNVGLTLKNDYTTAYVVDDLAAAIDPLSEDKVIDSSTIIATGVNVSLGLEYRVGKGRIQGVFSGNLLYAYSATITSYSYGNAVTSVNQSPSNGGLSTTSTPSVSYISSLRPLCERGGATHVGGLMGTAGVEWFLSSNISLGVEVNLIAAYAYTTQSYGEYEGYSANTLNVESYTNIASPAAYNMVVETGNYGSNITLNFYF